MTESPDCGHMPGNEAPSSKVVGGICLHSLAGERLRGWRLRGGGDDRSGVEHAPRFGEIFVRGPASSHPNLASCSHTVLGEY